MEMLTTFLYHSDNINMKLSQIVCRINKTMLNVKKMNMTSFFIMAPKICFEILSTLARYSASGF